MRRARDELHALRECLVGESDDTALKVMDAHARLLGDQELLTSVTAAIRQEHLSGAAALKQVFQKMISAFESAGTEYFRARSADIRDVRRRILKHLDGSLNERSIIPEGAIVVAVGTGGVFLPQPMSIMTVKAAMTQSTRRCGVP